MNIDRGKKKWHYHDQDLLASLTINGEDFSKHLKTGKLKQFKELLNKMINMGSILKHPKMEKLENMSSEKRITLRISLKSFHHRYHFGLEIDLISLCKPFSRPRFPRCIRVF